MTTVALLLLLQKTGQLLAGGENCENSSNSSISQAPICARPQSER
jgi:hypothetical protein